MSNEEKILEMLAQIQADQKEMKDDISNLTRGVANLNEDVSDFRTTVTRVAVTQENIAIPQIKLLAEDHDMLLQKLARKERVEALEDDVALLKTAIKAMSQRITELEKAQ